MWVVFVLWVALVAAAEFVEVQRNARELLRCVNRQTAVHLSTRVQQADQTEQLQAASMSMTQTKDRL